MKKNNELIDKILESIEISIENLFILKELYCNQNYLNFSSILKELYELIDILLESCTFATKNRIIEINIDDSCKNAIYSLKRIDKLAKAKSNLTNNKIEFELIPILEDLRLRVYYWGKIYLDKEKIKRYYENDIRNLCSNRYINNAILKDNYKYDVSILVIGYNNIEYTKICIDNLMRYVPNDLNYELILLNHGSSDETKSYFELICPTKHIDIMINGASPTAAIRALEGRYTLFISNDVVVTQNSINNMIKCMDSDENIGWVVPATPNVSNLQSIDAEYSSIEEMHLFAKKNNILNPSRWEQRVRLCNPIDLKRSSIWYSFNGIGWGGYFSDRNTMSFSDDKASLLLRRKGYKMLLVKDSYCHHFGSVTIKSETETETNFYDKGRTIFKDEFGIDPWGIGFCYDYNLFKYLECSDLESVDILGINCGIGSNPLKVKEKIKEETNNIAVKVYNITDDKNFIEDLKGVSDYTHYTETIELDFKIKEIYKNVKFKYIIFESNTYKYNMNRIIKILKNKLVHDGILCVLNLEFEGSIKIKSSLYENAIWYVYRNKTI